MPDWLKDAVFYEIYPQSFYDTNGDGIGDINGITEKLDYVKWLGCNAIWINPCFDSPFRDAGYDVRNYKKVAPRYGTNRDLSRLFQEAHKKGIKILLDLVPGHTSEQHPWFKKSCRPEKNRYTNRYIWTDSVWDNPRDYHFISGRAGRDGNYLVNFFSTQPALNYGFRERTAGWQLPCDHPDCIATRKAMEDVMRFWLQQGCDGFRVDMADSLVKNDDEKKSATGEIWKEIRSMLDREFPDAALVSEWSNPELSLQYGFHCDFYLNHKGNGYYSLFRDTDPETGEQRSFFSSRGTGNIRNFTDDYLPKYRRTKQLGRISFLTCNHDTPRMSRDFSETEMKLACSFIFTMPGVPFLYYGDEIGMKYLGRLTSKEGGYERTGSRTPMQWNKRENAGFSTAPADRLYLPVDDSPGAPCVEEQAEKKDSLLNTVRTVIKLRHENPCMQADGPLEVVYAERNRYPFVFRRGGLLFAFNPSALGAEAPVRPQGTPVFAVGGKAVFEEKSIRMAPQSLVVIRQNP